MTLPRRWCWVGWWCRKSKVKGLACIEWLGDVLLRLTGSRFYVAFAGGWRCRGGGWGNSSSSSTNWTHWQTRLGGPDQVAKIISTVNQLTFNKVFLFRRSKRGHSRSGRGIAAHTVLEGVLTCDTNKSSSWFLWFSFPHFWVVCVCTSQDVVFLHRSFWWSVKILRLVTGTPKNISPWLNCWMVLTNPFWTLCSKTHFRNNGSHTPQREQNKYCTGKTVHLHYSGSPAGILKTQLNKVQSAYWSTMEYWPCSTLPIKKQSSHDVFVHGPGRRFRTDGFLRHTRCDL